MKCLKCGQEGLPIDTAICPNLACQVHLPSLMRDMLPPGTLLRDGAYKIDYALGQGGFGITYRGFSILFDEPVAIKEFFPQTLAIRESDTGRLMVPTTEASSFGRWQERFLREGRMLRQLSQPRSHPHVVQVKDLFEGKGTAYMVMELIDGISLAETLEQRPKRQLREDEVQRIMSGLVDALSAVHEQGIYHLDLKPDNVLLRPNREPVLVDFGAARYGLERATMKRKRSSSRAFTLSYAPPELLSGETLGPESDIFELGMMLHEMLTGTLPPGVLNRTKDEVWEPREMGEPWKSLVREALRYSRTQRPHSVMDWWTRVSGPAPATIPISPPPPPRLNSTASRSTAGTQPKIGVTAIALIGGIAAVFIVGLAGAVGYLVAKTASNQDVGSSEPEAITQRTDSPPALDRPTQSDLVEPELPGVSSEQDIPSEPSLSLDSIGNSPTPPISTPPSFEPVPPPKQITYYGQKGTYTVDYDAGTYYGCLDDSNCLFLGADQRVSHSSWRNGSYLYVVNSNEVFVEQNGSIIFNDIFN